MARDNVFDLYEDWENGTISSKWSYDTGDEPYKIELSSFSINDPPVVGTYTPYEGKYSITNSTITDPGTIRSAILSIQLNLSNYAKVSYFGNCWAEGSDRDYLTFLVDGNEQSGARIQGSALSPTGWINKEYNLSTPKLYTLTWKFVWDLNSDVGADRGWVDLIIVRKYPPSGAEPTTNSVKEETKKDFYDGTVAALPAAKYYSSILDSSGENTVVQYSSWSTIPPGSTNILIYMRVQNTPFASLIADDSAFTGPISNDSKPSLSSGRYIQYYVKLLGNGATTPVLKEISIKYETPPPRPTEFKAIAISTFTINWMWVDNANAGNSPEKSFRMYSSTKAYPTGGYIPEDSTTSYGLIKELPPDTTYWIETGLTANTTYSRFIVAVNDVGGNAGIRYDGGQSALQKYTKAVNPEILPQYYFDDPGISETQPLYVKISTGIWTQDRYLKVYSTHNASSLYGAIDQSFFKPIPSGNFISQISAGPGKMQYYRTYWDTVSTYTFQGNEQVWSPVFTSTIDAQSGNAINKSPEILIEATYNSSTWYFYCAGYNGDNELSASVLFGPYYFNGCPSMITDLTVSPSTVEEGGIILNWTAPWADSTFSNISNGRFIIKYQTAGEGGTIDSDSEFNSSPRSIILSTTCAAGQKQTYSLTGLTLGTYYYFSIKAADSENNLSQLSNSPNAQSSKVSQIVFITSPYTRSVDEPTGIITIETKDTNNNTLKISQDVNISISISGGSSTGLFSQDLNNWIYPLSVTIPKGSSQVSFYYKDTQSGSPEIFCQELPSLGWTDATQPQTIIPGLPTAFKVVFPDGKDGSDGLVVIQRSVKNAEIKAIDSLGNPSNKYFGNIISSNTPSAQVVNPSTHSYTVEEGGTKTVTLRNYTIAGPAYLKIQETSDESFKDTFFITDSIGWAVGEKGTIKKTVNQGSSWSSQQFGTSTATGLFSIYFVNSSTGWAAGASGLILKTTDSGLNWFKQASGVSDT
ncbi:MAG: YCF48-related protein, partial [Elusimicrobiota bacterium]